MSHKQQLDFVLAVRDMHPAHFKEVKVLEIGSLDINGTIRIFFDHCDYIGCDIGPGLHVDIVCPGEQLAFDDGEFDTVASCECFEHNPQWEPTFRNMHRMTKVGGLVFFSCATTGRPEHGTTNAHPMDAPHCGDYYRNLTREDFEQAFDLDSMFSEYRFGTNEESHDLYFYGIRK